MKSIKIAMIGTGKPFNGGLLAKAIVNNSMSVKKHPKCRGFETNSPSESYDFGCDYNTTLDCDECKYGAGRKDPEAKCNQDDGVKL